MTQRYGVPFFAKPGGDFQRNYPKGSSGRVRLEQVGVTDAADHPFARALIALGADHFGSDHRVQVPGKRRAPSEPTL